MGWFLAGVAILMAGLLGAKAFIEADPKTIVRRGRWILGGLLLILGLLLLATGNLGLALGLGFLALTALRRRRPPQRPSPGQTSNVATQWVSMTLDHRGGEIQGSVLKGRFAGRSLGDLDLEEALALRLEVDEDAQSAALVEAYLDRRFGEAWRDAAGAGPGPNQGETMTRARAAAILGVAEDADEDAIREAHRRLIKAVHPDAGGASALAAEINRAKDVMLAAL